MRWTNARDFHLHIWLQAWVTYSNMWLSRRFVYLRNWGETRERVSHAHMFTNLRHIFICVKEYGENTEEIFILTYVLELRGVKYSYIICSRTWVTYSYMWKNTVRTQKRYSYSLMCGNRGEWHIRKSYVHEPESHIYICERIWWENKRDIHTHLCAGIEGSDIFVNHMFTSLSHIFIYVKEYGEKIKEIFILTYVLESRGFTYL